jgi:hypothetical protein
VRYRFTSFWRKPESREWFAIHLPLIIPQCCLKTIGAAIFNSVSGFRVKPGMTKKGPGMTKKEIWDDKKRRHGMTNKGTSDDGIWGGGHEIGVRAGVDICRARNNNPPASWGLPVKTP